MDQKSQICVYENRLNVFMRSKSIWSQLKRIKKSFWSASNHFQANFKRKMMARAQNQYLKEPLVLDPQHIYIKLR